MNAVSVNAVMFIQWDLAQCLVNKSKQMDVGAFQSEALLDCLPGFPLLIIKVFFFNKLTCLMIKMPLSIIKLNSVFKVTL